MGTDSSILNTVALDVTPFWLPKAGLTDAEYEDACGPRRPMAWQLGDTWRCAVADGATEAAFTGIWAKILVRAYVMERLDDVDFHAQLAPLRAQWRLAVDKSIGGRQLPWYAEEKRRSGAFAALVGLTLWEGGWSALAVGDCCLFQVRDGELLTSFPLDKSSEFGSRPVLVSTNPAREDVAALRVAAGPWRAGDTFYLMSDALAAWFLRQHEQGTLPWPLPLVDGPTREADFAAWIGELRAAREMRNDDVTLVRVETHDLAFAF